MVKCLDQYHSDNFSAYNGDCIDVIGAVPDDAVHMSVFSPPFADLYSYSDSPRDMGNCRNYSEFFEHFRILVAELWRITTPGRICAVHCMDIPSMKERDGVIGVKDFSGDIIRCFTQLDWVYHSRTLIWKDPLIEATRTKAIGLMHKQLCKDSTMSRCGLPDYLLAFRKPGDNPLPVSHPDGLTDYFGSDDPEGTGVKRSHNIWRAYASPVWMDVRQTLTLSKGNARDEKDEKHVCPLQLDTIMRAVTLWSNPGDTVLTPFMGIGSEVYGAVKLGRRGVGIELKPSYYKQAVKNLKRLESDQTSSAEQPSLLDALAE
jgi:DNA modification methylase